MEHWIKYKAVRINLAQCREMHCEKVDKEWQHYENKNVKVEKGKQWVAFVGYTPVESFATKEAGSEFLDKILAGDYDAK